MNLANWLVGIFAVGLILLICALWHRKEAREVGKRFLAPEPRKPPDE